MFARRNLIATVIVLLSGVLVFSATGLPVRPAWADDGSTALVAKDVDQARADLKKLGPEPKAFVLISKIIRPSVVSVITKRKVQIGQMQDPFGDDWPFDVPNPFKEYEKRRKRAPEEDVVGMGSGVVVDKLGHILTNNHVIEGAKEISVILADESKYTAELVGTDPKTDVAVIKLKDCPADKLIPATIGDSDKLEVGEWVLTVGAPFGLTKSVSAGIVSAKGRSGVGVIASQYRYEDFIQTDAAINRGNSGGPLVNYEAEVVGINTAIVTQTGEYAGVGFAIPSNMARKVMEQLISKGKVVRGYLGVEIRDVSDDDLKDLKMAKREGILVNKVYPDTPAEQAGLRDKDVILAINGKTLAKVDELRGQVAMTSPGQKIKLELLRDGKPMTLDVVIEEQPEEAPSLAAAAPDAELGITVQTLTNELATQLGVDAYRGEKGVVVMSVTPGSPADRAGLKIKDLIKEVANKPVTGMNEYQRVRKGLTLEKGVLLLVKTGDMAKLVLVK